MPLRAMALQLYCNVGMMYHALPGKRLEPTVAVIIRPGSHVSAG